MIPSKLDIEILKLLSEDGGFTTKSVSDRLLNPYCSDRKRMRSGAVRSWLMSLEKVGWVDFMNGQKPVCWKRTEAGTAVLSQDEYSGDKNG